MLLDNLHVRMRTDQRSAPNRRAERSADERRLRSIVECMADGIIVVNAGAEGEVTIDKTSKLPGLKTIVGGISGTPMDNYSFDSIQLLLTTVGSTARLQSGVRYADGSPKPSSEVIRRLESGA